MGHGTGELIHAFIPVSALEMAARLGRDIIFCQLLCKRHFNLDQLSAHEHESQDSIYLTPSAVNAYQIAANAHHSIIFASAADAMIESLPAPSVSNEYLASKGWHQGFASPPPFLIPSEFYALAVQSDMTDDEKGVVSIGSSLCQVFAILISHS